MRANNVKIIVITAKDAGDTPIEPAIAARFESVEGESAQAEAERQRAVAIAHVGNDPVFTVSTYDEWLCGARPDPAIIYGRVSPGWDACLDDPDWFADDIPLNRFRFDPAFSDEERTEAAKLAVNDDDCGGGMSMVSAKLVYDVYPLRSGAAALRVMRGVSGSEPQIIKRYDTAEDALAAHLLAESAEEDGDIRLAQEIENEALGWPDERAAEQQEVNHDDTYEP